MGTRAAAVLWTLAVAGMQVGPADAVARASAYAAGYDAELGGLVAQEDYQQDLPQLSRRLKSDFMLVKFSADGPWISFRDVLEADGKQVSDRQSRLEHLFLSADPKARDNAERISRESSRYNLGKYFRNTNTPILGLEYLKPGAVQRSRFETPRRETVDGEPAWRVDFKERGNETVVQNGDDRPLPAQGTVWIRASDGAVLRTLVRLNTYTLRSEVDVQFCAAASIKVLVPCRMTENQTSPGERLTSVATYSNVRRFSVSTSETIKH
jgi:hypothetical protein